MIYEAIETDNASAATPRVTFDREPLLAALDYISKHVVERRNTIPILENVMFEAQLDGQARLTATDLDMYVSFTIAANWEAPVAFTLPAITLRDIVKKAAKDAQIVMHIDDGQATIWHGRGKQKLASLPVDDFPIVRYGDMPISWECDAQELRADLALVSPAISKEQTRYYLNGVYLHATGDGMLSIVATDGHRMSRVVRPSPIGEAEMGVIFPRKALKALTVALKDQERAALAFSAAKSVITCGNMTLCTKLIDGKFPDYARIIPDAEYLTGRLSVDGAELLAHCKTVGAPDRGNRNRTITLELRGSGSRAGQSGKSSYARPLLAEYKGDNCTISLNPTYLESMAKAFDRLEIQSADMDSSGTQCPVLFTSPSAPHWLGVLMPTRGTVRLPAPVAVKYIETKAAAGQAADLFGVESGFVGAPRDAARVATNGELQAYALDYAHRLGLTYIDYSWTFSIAKWDNLERVVAVSFDAGFVPERHQSITILLPGYGQDKQPVTVQYADDTGEYCAPMTCTNSNGKIALPDAPKIGAKARTKSCKVKRQNPVCTPIDAIEDITLPSAEYVAISTSLPVLELDAQYLDDATASTESVIEIEATYVTQGSETLTSGAEIGVNEGQADMDTKILAMLVRIAALELALQHQVSPIPTEYKPLPHDARAISVATAKQEIAGDTPPIGEMNDNTPLSGKSKLKRTDAHVRAIMGYLAMRKERARQSASSADTLRLVMNECESLRASYFSAHSDTVLMIGERDQWRVMAEKSAAECLDLQKQRDDAQGEVQRVKALSEIGNEHYRLRLDDIASLQNRRRRAVLKARDLQKRLRRVTTISHDRLVGIIQLGKDKYAQVDEIFRLKRVAYQQAGHIVVMSERLDRAEALLTKSGPALRIVPPASLALAA